MKKIYLFAMASILMLSANSASAQCPQGARVTNNAIGGFCVLFVSNFPPNTIVVVIDVLGNTIKHDVTNSSGFVSIDYDCSKVPGIVSTVPGTCDFIVPPQAVLPIKLTSFNARLNDDNSVALNWVSAMELTSFKYVVQKSNDGLNFSDIGDVPAAGNSDRPLAYSFSDNNFVSGASYFRLKQVDIDGKTEYSKVVYVNNRKGLATITTVSPNPFVSDVQLIGISASELNSKNVQVYNSFGQRVNYRISGSNAIEIDPSSARGVYILKVKTQTFKLVKN